MRDRNQSTVVASSDYGGTDQISLVRTVNHGGNPAYYDHMSLMRDDTTKGTHRDKPCVHLSYNAIASSFSCCDSGDMSNAPNPRTVYDSRVGFHYGQHLPDMAHPDSYISVTPRSSNDIDMCVFNAYNQYINGVRALDASQSIAESGETPQLFNIWARRRGLATNLTNGFLNYSFGWRPVLSDLRAISKELTQFPSTVRKRLRAIGQGQVVRHFKFDFSDTIDSYGNVMVNDPATPYYWNYSHREFRTKQDTKRRTIVVTVRANVKPKLSGDGQVLLNKLGALGLIPSLVTAWQLTRLSFVVDWFYNIGGAIENLQGCLTHDISNVTLCLTDTRYREIEYLFEDVSGGLAAIGIERQKYFSRTIPARVPFLPSLTRPRSAMQYVLLGFIALTNTSKGKLILRTADRYLSPINKGLDRLDRLIGTKVSTFVKRRFGTPNGR